MPRIFRLLAIATALLLAGQAQARPPYPTHFEPESGKTFVFIGDETTYQGNYTQYVANFFYLRYPDKQVRFYNCGSMNDTVEDVLFRFEDDLAERKPYHSIVVLGTWDAGFENFDQGRFRQFQNGYGELLDKLDRLGGHPILVTPPMFDGLTRERRMDDESYRFRLKDIPPEYNGVMAFYGAWIREEAVRRGLRFADVWGPMNDTTSDERRTNPLFTLQPDTVHPDPGGAAIMAASILETLNPERRDVGNIRLMRNNDAWESRVSGGVVENLSGSPSEVKFIWKARYLPWAMPDHAIFGAELANIGERFNREVIQVAGLAPGDYELFIADTKVGFEKYTANDFAEGIALHDIYERPGYLRAQQVANANLERYNSFIQPWRDHWQDIKRVRVNFPEEPDKWKERLAELLPEINALLTQAREAEDAIYEIARPLARSVIIEPYRSPKDRAKEEAARLRAEAEAAAAEEAAKPEGEGEGN